MADAGAEVLCIYWTTTVEDTLLPSHSTHTQGVGEVLAYIRMVAVLGMVKCYVHPLSIHANWYSCHAVLNLDTRDL